jgi:hypothetical protein
MIAQQSIFISVYLKIYLFPGTIIKYGGYCMEEIKKLLEARRLELMGLKKEKEKALRSVPQGTLRISNYKNRPHYYYRKDKSDRQGHYITKDNMHLVNRLAQKDYDEKVLASVRKELSAIERYFACCPGLEAECIYSNLNKERQNLVFPVKTTDEQFIEEWKSVEYQGKHFYGETPEYVTMNGDKVRSKSEWIIADLLTKEGIPYRYEYPLYLSGFYTVYPDFTLLDIRTRKEVYYEHFGMMDDPEYSENAVKKLASYEQNGIYLGENLLCSFETRQNPLNPKQVQQMIKHHFGIE